MQLCGKVIRGPASEHHDGTVTMETGMPGFVNVLAPSSSVSEQMENKMHVQAPLTTVFLHTMPGLAPHPQAQAQLPPAASQDPPALHLSVPPLCSKETLPFLTLHIAGGLQLHQQATSLGTAAVLAAKSKSAGKHMCPHCGRDCLKPSVLEKHLRCHTGERPYPCTTCGISFKTQSNLYKHKRTQAHARLSSESEQSSLSSQESLQSSRDTCSSSLSVDALSEDSGSMEKDVSALPALTTTSVSSVQASTVQKVGPDTGWALHQAALVGLILAPVNEQKELSSLVQSTKPSEVRSGPEEIKTDEKEKRAGNKKPPVTPNRHHLPLQRQEATLFSKQWSSMSRGKSQSHDSTDSGFSESSEHHWTSRTSSPGSVLHDHSMESLTESSMELHDQPNPSQTHTGPGLTTPETKSSVSEQEQKKLEERISKLISENDAVVDDKHLENVRPRKTVLSKQGSIDLPMPYTYKDSFHFEMRTNKHSNAAMSWHRPDIGRGRSAMYCSVPTQRSTSLEHAPLTRSSSLPFNVSIQHSERSSIASPHHRDYVTLGRRGSSGQIYPACFVTKSVDQQASHHRPLVRQAAVDCIPTTEGLGTTSSVEEVRLSLDGDSTEISGEPSSRKYRRKKTQKFAYNKWYMYGGGTFKKLYSTEKSTDHSISKAKKSMTNLEHDGIQEIHQRCSAVTLIGSKTDSSATVCHPSCLPANLPPATHVDSNQPSSHHHSSCFPLKNSLLKKQSFSTQPSSIGLINTFNPGSADRTEPVAEKVIHEEKHTDGVSQHCVSHIPSERKKQRTDDTICAQGPRNHQNTSKILTQCFPSVSNDVTNQSDRLQTHSQDINLSFINHHLNPKHIQPKEASSPPCMVNANRKSLKTSSSISTTAKTSFLPKYQLKLPTTAEPDPHPSALTLNQPTGTISYNTTCTITGTPSQSCQTLSSTMTSGDRNTSASSQQTHMEPFNLPERPHPITITGSAQSQSAIPVTTTTQSQSITTVTRQQSQTALPIPGLVHAESATITTTVASQSTTGSALVKSQHVELTTALVQTTPPNPVIASAQSQSSTPIIVSVQNLTEPIAASVQNQPGARSTISTQNQYPAIIQAAAPSEHINPLNSMTAEVNPATIPCQIIPFNDSPQSAAHNVFHVRTADLQICLQIISDEQLALMEPQIERQGLSLGAGLSQRNLHGSTENAETMINSEGTAREVSQQSYCLLPVSEAQESSKKDMEREMTEPQKQTDPRETENVKNIHFPSQPECFHQTQENTTVPMHGSLDKSEKSDILESTLPTCTGQLSQRFVSSKLPGPLFHPQTHTNMLTQKKAFGVMSALGSLKGVKSDRNQTGEGEKDVLPLCFLSEEHLLPKSTISQKGLISEMISGQYKLCLAAIAPPSPTSAAESSSGNRLLEDVSQHKPLNQRAKYNVGRLKTKHGTPVHEAPTSEGLTSGQRSHAESSVSFHSKDFLFPLNHVYENPGEPNPQETQFSQMTSVPCCFLEERPKDVPGVSAAIQSVTAAGVKEGGPLTGCALQRESESQTLGHARIPREPESRDAEPRERQGPGQMDNQPLERQEGRGAGEREVDSRGKRSQKGDVPEQREGKVGTGGVFAHLSDVLREDNDETKDEADSKQNSWLAVQPHQQFSQTAGMFYNPLQTFKHESGSSNIPHPPGGSDTSIFNTSLPLNEIKTKSVLISQLPINSETSILHTHRAPNFGETHTKQSHQTQDQCETNIPATTQSLPQRQTIDQVSENSLTICYNNTMSSSKRPRTPNLLPVVKPPHSTYCTQMSHPDDINTTSMEVPKDPQAACHGGNDTTMHAPDPSTSLHLESSFKPQRVNLTALSHTTHSNIPLRPEGLSKDNSVSSDDQILSYPTPDCLTISSVRAVQSGLEDLDDTSSSDDEGKLIIEL